MSIVSKCHTGWESVAVARVRDDTFALRERERKLNIWVENGRKQANLIASFDEANQTRPILSSGGFGPDFIFALNDFSPYIL